MYSKQGVERKYVWKWNGNLNVLKLSSSDTFRLLTLRRTEQENQSLLYAKSSRDLKFSSREEEEGKEEESSFLALSNTFLPQNPPKENSTCTRNASSPQD